MTKSFSWNELDERAVAFGKALAADAVEKVGSGHPGAAISLTAAAYLLYQKEMRVDPACPTWLGRDRFILSAGHASVMQYVQLVLAGYGLEVSDLEQLRKRGSRTPAHPEYGHTPGRGGHHRSARLRFCRCGGYGCGRPPRAWPL